MPTAEEPAKLFVAYEFIISSLQPTAGNPKLMKLESFKIEGFHDIVALDLAQGLPALKNLETIGCNNLVSVVGLSNLPSLEKLKLSNAQNLMQSTNASNVISRKSSLSGKVIQRKKIQSFNFDRFHCTSKYFVFSQTSFSLCNSFF